jgi:hypothetical protein
MEAAGGEFSHVLIDGHVGPMLSKDRSAIGLDFTECDGSHSGSFESKAKTADP